MAKSPDRQSANAAATASTSDGLPQCQKQLQPFSEAFSKLLQDLREAYAAQARSATDAHLDFYRRARETHSAFLSAPANQKTSSWKDAQDLQVKYVEAVQDIGKNASSQAADAYRAYLRGVQAAWAQTDVNILDAPALAAISNSIQLAAYYAYAARVAG